MNSQFAATAYSKVHHQSQAQSASPHRLVLMLFDGALERIVQAKGAMQFKNIELKGKKITSAIAVVGGLRESLNVEQGGEIAQNLDALYVYIQDILLKAHRQNEEKYLDEANHLLAEIRDAWVQIG